MHIKKNLAIAAAVAVLAVPALGATNANADTMVTLRKPVTAKVEHEVIPAYHDKYVGYHTFPAGDHVSVNYAGTNGIGLNLNDSHNGTNVGNYADTVPGTSPSSVKAFAEEYGTQNNTSESNNTSKQSTNQNNNSNKNKLVQTGESNTKIKAGIVGVMAVMVSVAFAGVEKFFKRV